MSRKRGSIRYGGSIKLSVGWNSKLPWIKTKNFPFGSSCTPKFMVQAIRRGMEGFPEVHLGNCIRIANSFE